jgi:trehalose-phosphatase
MMHATSPEMSLAAASFSSTASARVRLLREAAPPQPTSALDRMFDLRSHARRRVLILDYDGTLAPPPAERLTAAPYDGVRELLARIRAHPGTRLVFVSGRPAREMADMLGLCPLPEIWGVYGWERFTPAGQLVRAILPAQAKVALARFRALKPQFEDAGALVEDKFAAIAVHWRSASAEMRQHLRALMAEFETPAGVQARLDGVFLEPFGTADNGGIELRAYGPNKGSIVRGVLREEPREAVVAYAGDDWSDEDAFRAVHGRGMAVRVLPPGVDEDSRASTANLTLRAPDELQAFLQRWAEAPAYGNAMAVA